MANEFSKPYCSTNNLYSEAIHFPALSSLLRPLKQMHVYKISMILQNVTHSFLYLFEKQTHTTNTHKSTIQNKQAKS